MQKPRHIVEPIEVELWLKLQRLNEEMQDAEKKVEAHFFPLIRAALEQGDVSGAQAVVSRMPSDCVARVFAYDMIRQKKEASL